MKLSTINTIYWVVLAGFWGLLIGDLTAPGQPPLPLDLLQSLCLYLLVAAHFYKWGANRSEKKTNTYEMSN